MWPGFTEYGTGRSSSVLKKKGKDKNQVTLKSYISKFRTVLNKKRCCHQAILDLPAIAALESNDIQSKGAKTYRCKSFLTYVWTQPQRASKLLQRRECLGAAAGLFLCLWAIHGLTHVNGPMSGVTQPCLMRNTCAQR